MNNYKVAVLMFSHLLYYTTYRLTFHYVFIIEKKTLPFMSDCMAKLSITKI